MAEDAGDVSNVGVAADQGEQGEHDGQAQNQGSNATPIPPSQDMNDGTTTDPIPTPASASDPTQGQGQDSKAGNVDEPSHATDGTISGSTEPAPGPGPGSQPTYTSDPTNNPFPPPTFLYNGLKKDDIKTPPSTSDENAAASSESNAPATKSENSEPGPGPLTQQQNLQARLALAQKTMAAGMQQRQERDATHTPTTGSPATVTTDSPSTNLPDDQKRLPNGMTMAEAVAMMGGASGSAKKEQILKQLEALRAAQAARASPSAPSPSTVLTPRTANPPGSTPAAVPDTPRAASSTPAATTPAAANGDGNTNMFAGPGAPCASPFPVPQTKAQPAATAMTGQPQAGPSQPLQTPTISTSQAPPPVATPGPVPGPSATVPSTTATPAPVATSSPATATQTPSSLGKIVQPSTPAQRGSFLQSLATYYKQENIPRPAELFNPTRLGAIILAGKEFHVVDLFLHVVRNGGFQKVMRFPMTSPMWTDWLASPVIGLPQTLPEPIQYPKPTTAPANDPPTPFTTDTVSYLVSLFASHLAGFSTYMAQKNMAMQRAAANKTATPTTPASASVPSPSTSTGPTGPSPATSARPGSAGGTPIRPPQPQSQPQPQPHMQQLVQPPVPVPPTTTTDAASPSTSGPAKPVKKRKRDKRPNGSTPSTPLTTQTIATPPITTPMPVPTPVPEAPPKRARYKVQYEPLHNPNPFMGGWDERAVASTFTKYNLHRPTRSCHELGVVDMEAILMGIRSRLPRELGYALTVLSMLSVPNPHDRWPGLPIQRVVEVFYELLELIETSVFGEEGYEQWSKRQDAATTPTSLAEMESLARDFDCSFPDDLDASSRQEVSGGATDTALCAINILRNLSMFKENQGTMANEPALCTLLSRITDPRLARRKGPPSPDQPYSLLELARIRRDAIVIFANIGRQVNLRNVPFPHVLAVFRLLSAFLSSAFTIATSRESLFGDPAPDRPPPIIFSICNAMEAFVEISGHDLNREVLSRVPDAELVDLFKGLVKMFPLTRRADVAMHSNADSLGNTETLAMALYSLAFISPISTRKVMKSIPGAVGIIKRMIFDSLSRTPEDFTRNPFGILTRRLCEVLGVLNGTATPAGEGSMASTGVSFGAGAGGGKGWKWASGVLEKGWMSLDEERIGEGLSVAGLDAHAFSELDGMWWGD